MVSAGILAASPHNMQNWFFSVTEQAIELYDDPTPGTDRSPGIDLDTP